MRLNPTLFVFVACVGLFFTNLALAYSLSPLSWWMVALLFVVQTVLVIVLFTPLHDSVHRTAHPVKWVNEAMLYGCWPMFMNSPYLFRRIHITHHARVNAANDPDHFTQHPSLAMRWLKSFLIVFHYYGWSMRECRFGAEDRMHVVLSPLTSVAIAVFAVVTGRYDAILGGWLLPSFVAIGILGYLNTAWPHHPGEDRTKIGATRILYVPRWLQGLMLNQNLHLLHHLNPMVPWYEYRRYWREHGPDLTAKGAKVTHWRNAEGRF